MKTLGIIGGGNMGEAIIAGAYKQYKVIVCEANAERTKYLKAKYKVAIADLKTLTTNSQFIVLAVKPQDLSIVLDQLAGYDLKGKLIISIAAGVTISFIEKRLMQKVKVIRTMPNMPALIGEGITALSRGKSATPQDLKTAAAIFTSIGQTLIVDEKWIDAVTAVSGSGPAYVFLFVECMMNAARELGFSEEQAKSLVYQTLVGSAHLLEKSADDAATLRAKVTSKGGTTQAAMDVFMAQDIQGIFQKAMVAARDRACELSK